MWHYANLIVALCGLANQEICTRGATQSRDYAERRSTLFLFLFKKRMIFNIQKFIAFKPNCFFKPIC